MIIILVGGIGSGKSLSVVKQIIDNNQFVLTNFKLKNIKNYHQLKYEDIVLKGEKISDMAVNWPFWNKIRKKHKSFSIYLDEVHNIANSRASMSKQNQVILKWLAQIRKILADSETNHLFLITQRLNAIDIFFRELAHIIIKCEKIERGKNVFILQTYYEGLSKYENNIRKLRRYFLGNPYFKFYNSTDLITFDDVEEYL